MINAKFAPYISRESRQLPMLHQTAALCYRIQQGRTEVLLITTRKSRNWIIPKGWLIKGLTPSESAQQEAWEEAGIRGKCGARALGQFCYQKRHSKKGLVLCVADVFPLHTTSVAARYPEFRQRQRRWFSPKKAASQVNLPDLALLLRKMEPIRH